MLLPPGYQDVDSYFRDALTFLSDYRWLYNVPVTEILIYNILDRIPQDWAEALLAIDNLELNELPYGLNKEWWPQSLHDFCRCCQNLKLSVRVFQGDNVDDYNLPSKLCRGLTPKKQHELSRLTTLIHEECLLKNITNILDVGSGLGYLGQVLHHRYGYRILGLESQAQLVKTAAHCQKSLCPTIGAVTYITCNISSESANTIQQCLQEQMPFNQKLLRCHCQSNNHDSIQVHITDDTLTHPSEKCVGYDDLVHATSSECVRICDDTTVCLKENAGLSGSKDSVTHEALINGTEFCDNVSDKVSSSRGREVCMVGLHTCGDLSASVSELFLKLPSLRLFIILPCCYHKMSLSYTNPDSINKLTDTPLQTKMEPYAKEDANDSGVIPERFVNFPQSHTLRKQIAEFPLDVGLFLRRPFLRLASQETCARWRHCSKEEHNEHSMQLIARALIYLYAHKEKLTVKKKRRRGVRKTQLCTFNTVLEDMLQRYDFSGKDNLDVHCALTELWSEYSSLCQLAEVLTGLQVAMQAVVESFVLVDKMVYLQENEDHLLSYDIFKVMDDQISPRCHALVARK